MEFVKKSDCSLAVFFSNWFYLRNVQLDFWNNSIILPFSSNSIYVSFSTKSPAS